METFSHKLCAECLTDQSIAREYLELSLLEWDITTGFENSLPSMPSYQIWEDFLVAGMLNEYRDLAKATTSNKAVPI